MEHQEAVDTLAPERYILGEMSEAERDSFEEHFFSCEICAGDVVAADRMREGARAGFAKAAPPAPVVTQATRRPWKPAIVIPWATAAMMTLVAGYESFHAVAPGAGALNRPIALAPTTLRAATRGEEPTIGAKPDSVLTLAVDLGSARFDRIKYEIRNERDELSGSGEAAAPTPGAPLLLLIPSSVFRTSGRYVLTLRDSTGAEPREYRFVVQAG
jgi:Putative zinc-finger